MSLVTDSERADFRAAIERMGYEYDDFELTEKRDPQPAIKAYGIAGSVTIERNSTRLERTYKAGHGSLWSASFQDDLSKGAFGKR
jgi:hypothetical protein